jgi:hypothetical protein
MYQRSIGYVLDKNTWKSNDPETMGKSRFLLHTRKSLKKVGEELKIFNAPSIVGIKIIYSKSLAYLFDSSCRDSQVNGHFEENYLLREFSEQAEQTEKELKIFKFPNIDYLERLYIKRQTHPMNMEPLIES